MRSSRITGEGELQLANPGSPGKMAIKTVCVWIVGNDDIRLIAIFQDKMAKLVS